MRLEQIEMVKQLATKKANLTILGRAQGIPRHTLERDMKRFESRGHHGIAGVTPLKKSGEKPTTVISLHKYRWEKHCKGLYQLPIALIQLFFAFLIAAYKI